MIRSVPYFSKHVIYNRTRNRHVRISKSDQNQPTQPNKGVRIGKNLLVQEFGYEHVFDRIYTYVEFESLLRFLEYCVLTSACDNSHMIDDIHAHVSEWKCEHCNDADVVSLLDHVSMYYKRG
jgi:hypothetical protein